MRHLLRRTTGFVWINKDEIAALARRLNMAVADFERDYVRQVGIRKSLIEYENGDCVFFDGEKRRCRSLRRPPAAMPHLALLGIKRPHARNLARNVRSLPRQRTGEPCAAGQNYGAAQGGPPLTPPHPVRLVSRMSRAKKFVTVATCIYPKPAPRTLSRHAGPR